MNGLLDEPVTLDEPITKAAAGFDELGASGLIQYGGVLAEEFLPQLQGPRGIAIIKEMMTDPVIGGVLLAIENLVRQVEWHFDPRPDSGAEGERWALHCETCLHDMSSSLADTMSSIFTMVPFGWSYCNVVLKHRDGEQPDTPGAKPSSDYDDGLVGWRKIDLRAQESLLRWEFDPTTNSLLGMHQQLLTGQAAFIPIDLAGLFRTSTPKGSPEGRSLLRSAYTPWYFKRRIQEIEAIGIERDLAGLPVAWVPPEKLLTTASTPDKLMVAAIKKLVTNVRRGANEGMIFPLAYDEKTGNKTFDFTLLTSAGRRQIDVDAVIARKNQEMAICVLADWLLLGHENVGSKALGSSKIDLFNTALQTLVESVAQVFDAHITPRLLRANGVSGRLAPTMRPGKVQQADLLEFAQTMGELLSSGAVVRDDDTENHIRDVVGLPPKMEQPAGAAA